MSLRLLTVILAVCLCASAQMKMTVEQLVSFVKSSIKLGHQDKRIAEYLKKVTLTERLEDRAYDEMLFSRPGPKTIEALDALREASRALAPPPPPPPKPLVTGPKPPSAEEREKVLDDVRNYAQNYSKQLPNFICVQLTRRYYDPSGLEFWQRDSTITAQLTFFEQREDYKIIMMDNRATTGLSFERVGGATSTGEFGSMLNEIFDPKSDTLFRWERWATLRGRRMHVFSYRVPQSYSKWTVRWERTQEITPGYRGLLYVDRDTGMLMRVTLEADDLPASFPIQQATQALDYDFTKIADREHLLPLKSVMWMRAGKLLVKNETEFRMYRRFSADVVIKPFDIETLQPLPENISQEQPAPPKP